MLQKIQRSQFHCNFASIKRDIAVWKIKLWQWFVNRGAHAISLLPALSDASGFIVCPCSVTESNVQRYGIHLITNLGLRKDTGYISWPECQPENHIKISQKSHYLSPNFSEFLMEGLINAPPLFEIFQSITTNAKDFVFIASPMLGFTSH